MDLTIHDSRFTSKGFFAGAALTIALVLYGFYVSLGEQKVFRDRVFAE